MARPAPNIQALGASGAQVASRREVFMRTFHRILSVLTLLALMSSSALIAAAQDQQDDQQYDAQYDGRQPAQNQPSPDDPPARAARLQFMSGSVSVQPRGTDDWVAGAVNRPLTNSDNIWADKNSRAEISVGTGLIRIDSESSLTLTNISENTVQLQLHQGALNLHVRRLYDGETYEVDTPNQAFTVLKPGDYRFDVDPTLTRPSSQFGEAKASPVEMGRPCASEPTSRRGSATGRLLPTIFTQPPRRMDLTSGRSHAMGVLIIPHLPATSLLT